MLELLSEEEFAKELGRGIISQEVCSVCKDLEVRVQRTANSSAHELEM